MATRQPFTIGHRRFDSKSAAKRHLKERLNSYQAGDRVTQEDQLLLDNLVDLHPEPERKWGPRGIDFWTVELNSDIGGRSLGFWLHWVGGGSDDFGYNKVIDGDSHEARVRAALHNAIRDITRQVRQEAFAHPPVCDAVTGKLLISAEDAAVVHTEPTWRSLCDGTAEYFGGYDAIAIDVKAGYHGKFPSDPQVVAYIRALQERHIDSLAIRQNPVPKP